MPGYRLSVRAALALFAAASPVLAQPRPPADPGAPLAERPEPPPQPAVEPEDPKIPAVDDPMLSPVGAPRRVLGTWQEAVRLARTRSTAIRTSTAQIEQAEAQSRQALAAALPSLTGTAGINHHLLRGTGTTFAATGLEQGSIPDPATTWNAGLGFRLPIFAPGAWHEHGTTKESTRAARLGAKDTRRIVLGVIADTIVSVVTTERVAEISRVSLRSALSTLYLTRTRARLGAASAVDVLRAEQEASLSRAQIVAADEGVQKAREALGLALGHSEPWGVAPNVQLAALANDARTSCRTEPSIDQRPDVLATAASVDVAERNVDNVDWQFAPTVDFVSNLNYASEQRFSANGEHVTWTIGAQLTWPLYDGGLRYGSKEANHSQLRIAREQHTETKRQARLEVAQSARGVDVARKMLEVSARSREIAKESARLARVAFVNGSGTSFDLVDAARRLREAEIDLAIKEFEVIRAQITALLARATCDA